LSVNPSETPPVDASRAGRPRGLAGRAYAFLVSPRLAIALLVAVLACCVVGVTVYRGARAWELIFSTLWFNALLVLLALSSGAAFFSRAWRRKLTLVSAGMILFHVSFLALLAGVVYDGLFHFKGTMRLTEGETLPNGRLESYDVVEHGRFFDVGRLRGETTLRAVHQGYKVDGQDKRAAYEILVEDGERREQGTIYVTRHLDFGGVRYFPEKEGYSLLVVLYDKEGKEQYGAHVPLQSLKQAEGGHLYATGSATEASPFPFPPPPEPPRAELLLSYRPNTVADRAGDVGFTVWPPGSSGNAAGERRGQAVVGAKFDAGDFALSAKEVRYWVGMSVRYDPGLGVILASLCSGLAGMVLTFVGRVRQGAARRAAALVHQDGAHRPMAARAGRDR
jgi:cytochrome c biogenesis protein ResB